ncbi:sialate O-acetylesterase [Dysgonomonas macrotermitis]|uniref:Sialate O-acetylesterase n=1 Tax=Dysgonomonas macrotermitis TaxID=1346286 RepID=A0A1M4Y0K3_9BACT|nr:sialate O-acetylesterase [Dysgonomonas macrotermitis]SHE99374.1 sialate O-acetylesterase [Dysgonomonas macrotermitis]
MKSTKLFILFFLVSVLVNAQDIKLAAIFTDNMVLQQQTQAPVWGWAKEKSKINITTSWDGKEYETVADNNGKWRISVTTPIAGGPYTIAINGSEKIELKNVFIGEVWLASGQSNMSMRLKGYKHQPVTGSTEAILNSKGKNVHFINIPELAAYRPQDDVKDARWETASISTTGECSAVCWFFADLINQQLDIPVGIINASYGGSNVEAWMTDVACSEFKDIEVPPKSDETSPWIGNVATLLYNGMIHPIEGYGIKGMLWYQGESSIFNVPRYAPSVAAMVKDWRKIWKQGDFPFYFAQIAPYDYKEWNFFTPQWPEISAYQREAQMKTLSLIPNSAMAVTLDVGEEFQIHPPRKKEVGQRLALLALAKTYGLTGFEYESPQYERMEVDGDKAIVYFSQQFMGLTSRGKELTLFEIAGENKVFVKAKAYIDEEKSAVVVSSHLVKEPKAVRYAFRDYVSAELFGTGGLPVSSFRTDNWE